MAEIAFLQRFCRAAACRAMFFVCRPCYRGQAYCSDPCRRQARRQQRRQANRRYQQDPGVRKDHRDRERERRELLRGSRVSDHTSAAACASGTIAPPMTGTGCGPPSAEEPHDRPLVPAVWRGRLGRIVCIICGRLGKFVSAFTRRE
jgi:hypothetical protein